MSDILLDRMKAHLRLTGNALDEVIKQDIDTALIDMTDAGIDISSMDGKICKAVELFLRWQLNFNGEAERYQKNYRSLCDMMSKQKNYILKGDAE